MPIESAIGGFGMVAWVNQRCPGLPVHGMSSAFLCMVPPMHMCVSAGGSPAWVPMCLVQVGATWNVGVGYGVSPLGDVGVSVVGAFQ